MIQEQISLLLGLLSGYKTQFEAEIWTDKSKIFFTKAIHNFTSHFKHVCLKKGRRKLRPSLGRMIHLQKTDAHIIYDTKYEMIHNFLGSHLKKHSTQFGWFFLAKNVGIGRLHYIKAKSLTHITSELKACFMVVLVKGEIFQVYDANFR